jgi:hypothetical protein
MVSQQWLPAGRVGLHRDEVEAERKRRNRRPIREWRTVEQGVGGTAQMAAFAMVDGLLRQAEVAATTPADLDYDEVRRRARVDRHEIELVATDMDVPGQDGPAHCGQPVGNQRFGGITRLLRRRARPSGRSTIHARIVAVPGLPAIDGDFARRSRACLTMPAR